MIVVAILMGVIGIVLGVCGKDSRMRWLGVAFSVGAVVIALVAALTGQGYGF